MILFIGDFCDGGGELGLHTSFSQDLGTQGGGQGEQASSRYLGEISLGEFAFYFCQLLGQQAGASFGSRDELVLESLEFDLTQVVDRELVSAAPIDKSAFGYPELDSDAVEAPTLGAKFDETILSLSIMHPGRIARNRRGGIKNSGRVVTG